MPVCASRCFQTATVTGQPDSPGSDPPNIISPLPFSSLTHFLCRAVFFGSQQWCRSFSLLIVLIRSASTACIMFRLFFLLLPLLLQKADAQLKQCYKYGGNSSPDFPCNPEAETSACCGQGYICRTNLYCEDSNDGAKYAGTCTDSNWDLNNDPACPFVLSTLLSLYSDMYRNLTSLQIRSTIQTSAISITT